MNKENIKSIYKKSIATGLSTLVGVGIALHQPEKSYAQTSEIPMTPITTVEDFYYPKRWNQEIINDYYNIINPQHIKIHEYIGMPIKFNNNDNDQSKNENNKRSIFYEQKSNPKSYINGIEDKNTLNNWDSFILYKELNKKINTKKQFADFTLQPNEKGFYILKVTGIDDQLNDNKNLNLNAIVLKREVNCDNNDVLDTTILKQIAYKYPLDALGEKIQIKNEQVIQKQLDLGIKDSEKAMCGLVAFLQDMKTKEIIAASYTDLTPEKTALFNIDHLPETTLDNESIQKIPNCTKLNDTINFNNKKEYQEQIGLKQKVISVTNALNLTHLHLELDYTSTEAEVYDVLGAALSEELQDKAKLAYDPKEHRVTIKFNEPLNGDHDIFNFFIKIHTNSQKGVSDRQDKKIKLHDTFFKFKNFFAEDKDFNTIKYEIREQKTYSPVRMVTADNPLDLNSDTNIDEKDIERFLPAFGVTDKDPNYINKYDIYPQNIKEGTQGDGRIDIQDLYHLVQAVSEQEELARKIKEVNPDFVYPTIDQSIKTRVLTQICDIIPPLGLGLDQNQELTFKAIANQIEDIYSIHGKTITKKEESKSLYQRIQEFFNTPTPHAISRKRKEEIQG